MQDIDLFQQALGLVSPWYVKDCRFDFQKKRLDIYIDFRRGGKFPCNKCGQAACKAYDTSEKKWRHLNFFEYRTFLHARVPRVECPDCGIQSTVVPWARPGSGFTLLFEAFIMSLVREMTVSALARLVGEHDTRIWRILHHYVEESRQRRDDSKVRKVGVDETSGKKGHNYISLFVDMCRPRVLFATEGKDSGTLEAFSDDLIAHGGDVNQIGEVSCDMSPAFICGIEANLPQANITYDKFHVTKLINEAMDEVLRQERKEHPELKGSRYAWLKNRENLSHTQKKVIANLTLKKLNLKTARAYNIKLAFQEFYQQPQELAETYLKKWYFWATHSRLQPIIKAAKTIKRHWQGILRWFTSRITNGILEGINSLVQAAKAKARGYRSTRNLIAMTYIIAGKLEFDLPT